METFNIYNNFYNDIHNAVNKLNNNEKLSIYDLFLLDNMPLFLFSLRTIRKCLNDFNNKD